MYPLMKHRGTFAWILLPGKSNKYYTFCVCIYSLSYPVCNVHAPYCHLWPVLLYHIFQHLVNGTIFG